MKEIECFKAEGTLVYPNGKTLTWGPYYFKNKQKAENKVNIVLQDIIDWVHEDNPNLNTESKNIKRFKDFIVIQVFAKEDENTIQKCGVMVRLDKLHFEEEFETKL